MFTSDKPIGELAGPWGVPIQFGGSLFLLFLVFVNFAAGPQVMLYDLMFFLILVTSIFLHELGHAWGALIQGIPVRRIMIFGGGGFCEYAKAATPRERELMVAMGPIVNAVLWAVFSLLSQLISDPEINWVFETIATVNFYLLIFNLIPVQPLDGGKLFVLFLYRYLNENWAVRISGFVGLVLCLLWIPAMLLGFAAFGFLLMFLPSIKMHWRMFRFLEP